MKNIFLIGMLALACAFTGCSSDDDNSSAMLLQNPSFKFINMAPYDLADLDKEDYIITPIDFSSTTAWQVSSDKIWVLFSTTEDGQYYNDIMGAAGVHRIYMKITNDARTFEPAGAKVVFNYGGNQYDLGTIYRHAKQHNTTILDENGEVITSVEIGGDASVAFKIDANYNCGIKSYPEWLSEPTIYNGSYMFNVIDEYTPYEMTGSIVVASEDGATEQAITVNYSGMDPATLRISGDYTSWGWLVSLDGKTFLKEGSASSVEGESEDVFVENALPFTIKCFNYDCKFLFIEENADGTFVASESGWLSAERSDDDLSTVNVVAAPFAATKAKRSRKGYIFAVPSGVYENILDSLAVAPDAATFVDNNINYALVEVTQKDIFAVDGFSVTGRDGSSFITEAEPAGDLYDWVSSELSISDVYSMTGINGVTYTVNTMYTETDWDGAYAIFDKSGTATTRMWRTGRSLVDGFYVLTFTVPDADRFTEPVVFRLHTNNINKKALIIKPVNY